jgi:hypothetical protein
MDSVTGPGAKYPAKRVECKHDAYIPGFTVYVIHEYRADEMVMSIQRAYPNWMIKSLGEGFIWAHVRLQFLDFLDEVYA